MTNDKIIDLEAEAARPVQSFLVGCTDIEGAVSSAADPLSELRGLVDTLGHLTVGQYVLNKREPAPKYGMGTGKAEEIATYAKAAGADSIIFDFELSPTHQRNWERLAGIPVFDRHEVILRIFAQRARTKEAVLQVELARLEYSLPRLAHSYGDMARQRGGSYGSKGSGETQLELDRRAVETKMAHIKEELAKVVKERETLRKKRDRIPLPVCALVGYTNAGKSSLLNALTGSDVFVENRLFATLDPTTRRLALPNGSGILISDTVGFISNLPHNLVNAFKSTLEEAARAELLLIVLDATDPLVMQQYETVLSVLKEIGADSSRALIVLNKIDAVDVHQEESFGFLYDHLTATFPEAVPVSAKTHQGFDLLTTRICDTLLGEICTYRLPLTQAALVAAIRKNGVLHSEEWHDDFVEVCAQVSGQTALELDQFKI